MNQSTTHGVRVEGTVNRIIFSKHEEFFHIFSILTKNRETMTVKGGVQFIRVGDKMEVSGEYEDTKFGRQIKASFIENHSCNAMHGGSGNREGLVAFLSSGIIKGIGGTLAERIVDKFGDETLSVIESSWSQLSEVKGVSAKKAHAIHEQTREQITIAMLMSKLGKYGISARMMVRINAKFGKLAIAEIEKNPYCLCRVDGIAFKLADRYAQASGIPKDSPHRLKEGVKHVLQEAVMSGGSCGLQTGLLIERATQTLEVSSTLVEHAIAAVAEADEIVVHQGVCYDRMAWAAEESIATRLSGLLSVKQDIQSETGKAVRDAEKMCQITLSPLQREAVILAINNSVSVITGQPGTGKTTIVQVLLSSLELLGEDEGSIIVAAPTGKAANRLTESCGKGMTQHRMLGSMGAGEFKYGSFNPLICSTLIVDEFSMNDVFLANATVRALKKGSRLVIVGDVDQLPSVGPGQVLKDIIDSKRIPVTRLTEIRRQGEGSSIVKAAAAVNAGQIPEVISENKDFTIVRSVAPKEMMLKGVARLLELGETPDSIQVLCPMKNGDAGVKMMNIVLQPILNPSSKDSTSFVERFETRFFVGDRVMQLVNNYDSNVFNGDVGKVSKVDAEEGKVVVDFDSAKEVEYLGTMLDSLALSYACTVHKFQGSEAKNVIIPITMGHYMMLKRNLVYTGITRARNRLLMVVEPSQGKDMAALELALSRTDTTGRVSRLASILRAKLPA